MIVTRGNVGLQKVGSPLTKFSQYIVWNNAREPLDLGPFGLYVLAARAHTNLLYVQDDDVFVADPYSIVHAWKPGQIVCNMSEDYRAQYAGKPDKLMGFGSVFEKALIRPTFERYLKHFPLDAVTLREPNRIFTALNADKIDLVDVPIEHMPYASDPDRLWKQPDHGAMRDEAYRRVAHVLAEEAKA